jgi:hypothetical protein
VDGYVEIPVDAIPAAGAFSFATWFYLNEDITSATVGDRQIINLGDDNSINDIRLNFVGIKVGDNSEDVVGYPRPGILGRLVFRVFAQGSMWGNWATIQSDSNSWTKNTWYFVCGTYDGTTIRLFVNGVQQTDIKSNVTRSTTPPSEICTLGWKQYRAFNGKIDHVRIFSNGLTAAQVLQLYEGERRYVERMEPGLNTDCCLYYDGANTTTFTGHHLLGKELDLVGDAVTRDKEIVSDAGVITLDRAAYNLEAGLPYSSIVQTMKFEGGNPIGSSQGRPKRWNEIIVRVKDSINLVANGERVIFTEGGDYMDNEVIKFTGDKRLSKMGWDRDGTITIEQDQPQPLTVLGITGTLDVGDA